MHYELTHSKGLFPLLEQRILQSEDGGHVAHLPLHAPQLVILLVELVLEGNQLEVLNLNYFLETVAFEGLVFENVEIAQHELASHLELADLVEGLFRGRELGPGGLNLRFEFKQRRVLNFKLMGPLLLHLNQVVQLLVLLLQALYFPLFLSNDLLLLLHVLLKLGLLLSKRVEFHVELVQH